jgi:hypothetical protein
LGKKVEKHRGAFFPNYSHNNIKTKKNMLSLERGRTEFIASTATFPIATSPPYSLTKLPTFAPSKSLPPTIAQPCD